MSDKRFLISVDVYGDATIEAAKDGAIVPDDHVVISRDLLRRVQSAMYLASLDVGKLMRAAEAVGCREKSSEYEAREKACDGLWDELDKLF